jgi:hypothetical protein
VIVQIAARLDRFHSTSTQNKAQQETTAGDLAALLFVAAVVFVAFVPPASTV